MEFKILIQWNRGLNEHYFSKTAQDLYMFLVQTPFSSNRQIYTKLKMIWMKSDYFHLLERFLVECKQKADMRVKWA